MKKVFLCLLIVCVFLAGCRDSASPFNGLDLEPNPAPDLESEPTPLFYLDYAYNFTEEDLQGRIPIFFDGGDERMERMIFFADTDLHDLKFHRWDGWDVIDEESVAYLGDFLFSVEQILTPQYYINFLPPIPLNLDFAVMSFKDSSGAEHSYTLGHSGYDGSFVYGNIRLINDNETGMTIDESIRMITDHGYGELYIFDDTLQEYRHITEFNRPEEQLMPKCATWLNDEILLVIAGFDQGSVTRGGDIFYYNVATGENHKIIETIGYYERRLQAEINFMEIIGDELKIYIIVHFGEVNFVFRYTDRIPLSRIYELIDNNEIMIIETQEIN